MSSTGLSLRQAVSPRFLIGRVRERGLLYCLKKGVKAYLALIFITLPGNLLRLVLRYPLYYMGVRFLSQYVRMVGHLAHDTDCYIKEGMLGMRPSYKTVMLAPKGTVANSHLLTYWRKYLPIITSPLLCLVLDPLAKDKLLKIDRSRYTGTVHEHRIRSFAAIQRAWGNRPPLLNLREEDRKRGWDCLESLGMPRDAWFVCVHAREPGYVYIGQTPEQSQSYHDVQHQRNVDIESYLPAIQAITERGGWCIRLGAPATKLLPPMKNVIDYAHSPVRSDWMDVFLCASCRFVLAGSGIVAVANIFGVPVAWANFADYEAVLFYGPHNINTPKLLWSIKENRYLTFKEIFDSPISHFSHGPEYDDAGIRAESNSPEDIKNLALEMLEQVNGAVTYTEEDERLQRRFKALMRPEHMSYGANARISRDFLRKYAHLLGDENP